MYTFNQMQRFRLWLRGWLGIVDPQPPPNLEPLKALIADLQRESRAYSDAIGLLDKVRSDDHRWFSDRLGKIEAELARLAVERYIPPAQPEPERKIIKPQTFRQFLAIVDQEQEKLIQEEENAIR